MSTGMAAQQEPSADRFMPRKCGDPFKPLNTNVKEDPWKHLLNPLLKKEKERCDAWKDEVQNLLIFAGLFSAIVTSFLIEAHSNLKPDDGDVLLAHILARLDFVAANGTTAQPDTFIEADEFSPKASDQRINAFWFISLVFSLATVLVGIVGLQWIREYERTHNDKDFRTWFSLHHMYTEALDRWYLPQIFTFLPLLLQIGLILFFIGLGEFVWNLDIVVAIPTIIFIALTLLFLVVTTMIPTLQALRLFWSIPRPDMKPPRVQCPYKSPQAWIFHRIVTSFIRFCSKLPIRKARKFFLHNDRREKLSSTLKHIPIYNIFFAGGQGGEHLWHLHGIGWLFQRDLDELRSRRLLTSEKYIENLSISETTIPQYDALLALVKIRDNGATNRDEHVLANTCFSKLLFNKPKFSSTAPMNPSENERANKPQPDMNRSGETAYGQYIHDLLLDSDIGNANGWRRYRLRVPVEHGSAQPPALLRESNEFTFRSTWNSRAADIGQDIREDLINRAIGIIHWMFSDGPKRVDQAHANLYIDFTPVTLLAHEVQANLEEFHESDYSLQLSCIVRLFFTHAATFRPEGPSNERIPTSYTSEYTREFISETAQILGSATNEPLALHFRETLEQVASVLRRNLTEFTAGTAQHRPDYLFFSLFILDGQLPSEYNHPSLRSAIAQYTDYLRSLPPGDDTLDTSLANSLMIKWAYFTHGPEEVDNQLMSPTKHDFENVPPASAAVDDYDPPTIHMFLSTHPQEYGHDPNIRDSTPEVAVGWEDAPQPEALLARQRRHEDFQSVGRSQQGSEQDNDLYDGQIEVVVSTTSPRRESLRIQPNFVARDSGFGVTTTPNV